MGRHERAHHWAVHAHPYWPLCQVGVDGRTRHESGHAMSIDLHKLNADLARALGVSDLKNVSRITLELSPLELPVVTVKRHLKSADMLQTAVEVLRLEPRDLEPAQGIRYEVTLDSSEPSPETIRLIQAAVACRGGAKPAP